MGDGYFLFKEILGDITFNFDDNGYLHLSNKSTLSVETSPTNCKNCGAILHYKNNKSKYKSK